MKKSKKILLIVALAVTVSVASYVLICIGGIFVLSTPLLWGNYEEYYQTTGWSYEEEEFDNVYIEKCINKLQELKGLYNIDCSELIEHKDHYYDVYLYNDLFTIKILLSYGKSYGKYSICLYYYGDEEHPLEDYESQKNLVNLVNDFTNYASFDSKTDQNHFERLHMESVQKSSGDHSSASDKYHFDHVIGYVGYSAGVYCNNGGYYYKVQKNSELDVLSNNYAFDGILKRLE